MNACDYFSSFAGIHRLLKNKRSEVKPFVRDFFPILFFGPWDPGSPDFDITRSVPYRVAF